MVRIISITALFVFFALTLWSVRGLDSYSARYVACADLWKDQAQRAQFDRLAHARLMEQIERPTDIRYNGQVCPALRPAHKDKIRKLARISPPQLALGPAVEDAIEDAFTSADTYTATATATASIITE